MFTVTLHHLSADAKRVGVEYPDREQSHVTEQQLRELITAFAAVGARDHQPATPELRIAAANGRFVVQAVDGRLRFNSWTIRVGGADLTPDEIFAIVTGTDDPAEGAKAAESFRRENQRSSRRRLALIAALIVGTNSLTAWMLLRPPPPNPFLPEYRLLAGGPAERLLNDVAGEYQTGVGEGHRGMVIKPDGRVHWIRFGPKGETVEETDLTAKAAQSQGRPALFTSDDALIEFLDGTLMVFHGNTYRRKAP